MQFGNKIIRTQYLLDKKYQITFIVLIALFTVGLQIMFGTIIYYASLAYGINKTLLTLNFASNSILLERSIRYLTHTSILILIASAFMIGGWAFFFSHRIAGPAWKFKKVFRNIAKGGYESRIKLREGDYLKDLSTEVNAMLTYLDNKHNTQVSILQKTQDHLNHLLKILQSKDYSETDLQETTKNLTENLSRLSSITNYEKTP